MSEPLRDNGQPASAEELPVDLRAGQSHDRPVRGDRAAHEQTMAAPATGRGPAAPFDASARPRRPRFRPAVIAAVFLGGCIGGWARYAITSAWPAAADAFPWAVFAVNTAGAFILALVVVLAADVLPSRYLRPLVGTGFCGALTTFSSVVVTVDLLIAHHHQLTAAGYLTATVGAGLAGGALGLILGRVVAANGRRVLGGSTAADWSRR